MSSYDDGSKTSLLLQPYIESVSSTTSDGVLRAVIAKLLQDPDVFSGYNQVKSLLGTSVDPKLIRTLDLFSYGTIMDYYRDPESFIVLAEPQLNKLRQLTALTVIQNSCRSHQSVVPYRSIYEASLISTPNPGTTSASLPQPSKQLLLRETEQLLAPLIAARMVTGKFSQKQEALLLGIGHTTSFSVPTSRHLGTSSSSMLNDAQSSSFGLVVQSRDVRPDAIPSLVHSVQQMRTRLLESNLLAQKSKCSNEKMQAIQHEPQTSNLPNPESLTTLNDPMIVDDTDTRATTNLTAKRSRDGSSGVRSSE